MRELNQRPHDHESGALPTGVGGWPLSATVPVFDTPAFGNKPSSCSQLATIVALQLPCTAITPFCCSMIASSSLRFFSHARPFDSHELIVSFRPAMLLIFALTSERLRCADSLSLFRVCCFLSAVPGDPGAAGRPPILALFGEGAAGVPGIKA